MRNKILVLSIAMLLAACSPTKPIEVITYDTNEIVHPSMPTPPANPGVSILVITSENVEANKAYVGFEYDEWLDFAKWMHEYKTYNRDLRNVIDIYKNQDETLETSEDKE